MSGILWGLAVIAFVFIVMWYLENEKAGDKDGTRGILGVKDEDN